MNIHSKRHSHTDEKQDEYMSCCFAACTNNKDDNNQKTIQDYLGGSIVYKIKMLIPTGIITTVRVKALIPRQCFCMLYAHCTVGEFV